MAYKNFILNYFFDNGTDSDMKTRKIKLMAGEGDVVKINSPFTGVSEISLEVVPPFRTVLQQVMVKKKVNAWYYLLPFLRFLYK